MEPDATHEQRGADSDSPAQGGAVQKSHDHWRSFAGPDTPSEALSTEAERPIGAPLGRRHGRGWLRLAQIPPARDSQARVLQAGCDGLAFDGTGLGMPAALESLSELAPTTPVVFYSNLAASELGRAMQSRGGIVYGGYDPLGCLARDGVGDIGLDDSMGQLTEVLQVGARDHSSGRSLRMDSGPWQEAGADLALDLAASVSGLLEYLRVGKSQGVPVGEVMAQMVMGVSVGSNILDEMARLRALRVLCERALRAAGLEEPAPIWIHASGSISTHSRLDPMTNALRSSTQTIAAALGGADAVSVCAFDALAPEKSVLGEQLAATTMSILALESGLGRVADPAGGSYHIERRTGELARAAWGHVQAIEARGGAAACLQDGWWEATLEAVWAETLGRFESGKAHVLGASVHRGEDKLYSNPMLESAHGLGALPRRRPASVFEP